MTIFNVLLHYLHKKKIQFFFSISIQKFDFNLKVCCYALLYVVDIGPSSVAVIFFPILYLSYAEKKKQFFFLVVNYLFLFSLSYSNNVSIENCHSITANQKKIIIFFAKISRFIIIIVFLRDWQTIKFHKMLSHRALLHFYISNSTHITLL